MTEKFFTKEIPPFCRPLRAKIPRYGSRRFSRALEYRGRTIYLCTDFCLGAFLADPDAFKGRIEILEKGKDDVETLVT